MRSFLLSLSVKFQVAVILFMTITLAIGIATLFSHFFDYHQLQSNTDLISSVYQVLGTIYAILLTFTLWGVWQNYCIANSSVQNEANALVDLVHIVEVSHKWNNIDIRTSALNYLNMLIELEWISLKHISYNALNTAVQSYGVAKKIVDVVQTISPNSPEEITIFGHTLTMLGKWLDARRTRLLIAKGNSAKALWPLLITGAFVIFAFNGLFIAKTVGIWLTLLSGSALIIGLTFFLIFSLDCPFVGAPKIDCEPFQLAVKILTMEREH